MTARPAASETRSHLHTVTADWLCRNTPPDSSNTAAPTARAPGQAEGQTHTYTAGAGRHRVAIKRLSAMRVFTGLSGAAPTWARHPAIGHAAPFFATRRGRYSYRAVPD